MIHDHWKALARLLGAPGAAEPPTPKVKAKASEPVAEASQEAEATPAPAQAKGSDELLIGDSTRVSPRGGAPQEPSSSGIAFSYDEALPAPPSIDSEASPLQEMIEASQGSGGSSWDELVEKLGVPSAGKATSGGSPSGSSSVSPTPSRDRDAASSRKSVEPKKSAGGREAASKRSSGFGSGIGGEFDLDEPVSASEEFASPEDSQAKEVLEPTSNGGAKDDVELDIDWGTPKRRKPSRRGGEGRREERGVRREPRESDKENSGVSAPRRGSAVSRESVEVQGAPEAEVSDGERREAPAREVERSERGSGRGRRRGQRQMIGEGAVEPSAESSEVTGRGRSRGGRGRKQEEFVEDTDDFASGIDLGLDSAESMATEDDLGEEDATRRRRRRGRRRRGGARGTEGEARSAEDVVGEEAADFGANVLPEATFDDDHEDDEEVVDMRRSRRRRRRGGGESVRERSTSEETAARTSDDEDLDSDVTYQTQRNVPTWLEAVDLLVVPNIESRKRDQKRGGGSQGGGASSQGGSGRPRGRR